jgi:hypothetical protein
MPLTILHDHFATEIGTPDEPASKRAVALHLGEHRNYYSRAILRDQATVRTLRRWCRAWVAAGHDPVPVAVLGAALRPPT